MNTQLSTTQNLAVVKPHFFLTSERFENGLIAVHLNATNLPKDFLGVAFHLPIIGENWSFEGSQLEGGWALQSQNLFTLVSLKDFQPEELIFGLSTKGDTGLLPETLADSPMATFFLKVGTGDYSTQFTNTVLSVQVNGVRTNLSDVPFDGIVINSGSSKGAEGAFSQPLFGVGSSKGHDSATQELFGTQETDFAQVQPGFVNVLGTKMLAQNPYETVFQVYWVTFFFVVILLLGVALAYICHRLLQRKR